MSYEPGAPTPQGFIPLSVPEIRGNEWKYIKECLDTGWVSTAGHYVERFEESIAEYVAAKYTVAVVNGTAALHIALLVAGIQPNDEVIVPALTFGAPANAVRYANAYPIFVDVEPDYWQLDVQKLADFLEKECRTENRYLTNSHTERRVRAILPVSVLGHPVDIDPIMDLAHQYDLVVIEDATESLGATYKGHRIGKLADISCFSFNGNKVITTGGGGMIATENESWAKKARYLTRQAKDDPLEYIHNEIGYNYRLTNIAAALGCAQVELLDEFVAAKRRIAATYISAFPGLLGVHPMQQAPWAESIFWMFTMLIDETKYGMDSRALLHKLEMAQIQSRPLWHPIHSLLPFANCFVYKVETANWLYQHALSLPCSVGLTQADQQRVIDVICDLPNY